MCWCFKQSTAVFYFENWFFDSYNEKTVAHTQITLSITSTAKPNDVNHMLEFIQAN